MLPKDQGEKFRALWEEFDAYETPEAKFAHVCDNVQPLMLNHATGGKSWRERGIRRSQVEKRNSRVGESSRTMKAYVEDILDKNVEKGNLKNE